MSKRCLSVPVTAFLIAVAVLTLSPATARSQGRVQIVVDSLGPLVQPGDTVTLSVTINTIAVGTSISAFDLLLAFDYHFMRPIDVEPGALLTSCGWEHFDYSTAPPNYCRLDSCPDGKIHLVGLADLASQPGSPSCYLDQPGEIARLTFEISSRELPDCYFYFPVRFEWDDCSDNMIALSTTLDTTLISNQVFQLSTNITDNQDFPTPYGAPDQCVISSGSTGLTVRGVDFIGGGVFSACPSPLASGAEIGLMDVGSIQWIGQPFQVLIDVNRIAPGYQLGSFDFFVKYDPTKMTFLGGSPGFLISPCNYASFSIQAGPDADCTSGPCPEGVLRIRAIATGLQSTPSCYIGSSGDLVRLDFQLANDSSLICSSVPIDFLWNRCGDNSFTEAPDELTGAFTRSVYDRLGFPMPDTGITFPSTEGPADSCLPLPNPTVDFFQGVLLVPCAQFQDMRGDINLNGISYEIADYVMFMNYMLYGSSTFTIDASYQIAASDVNADGLVLTLADMIYLYRVIVGDTVPVSPLTKAATDTVTISQDNASKSLNIQLADSLVAMHLLFDGEVTPNSNTLSNHTVVSQFDGKYTRLLIVPNFINHGEPVPRFGSMALTDFYTGDGVLIGAEATNDGVFDQPTQITLSGFPSCCVTRGNINHDADQKIDITDVTSLVQYMFAFGPPPACFEEANVDGSGDNEINIADLVYLIRFMFLDGTPPPSCPTQPRAWRYIATSAGHPAAEGVFTMSIDDPPFYAGQWSLNQVDPNAVVGPQVGHGAWEGDDSGGPLIVSLNTMMNNSQVILKITARTDDVWAGTWEFRQGGNLISSGPLVLEAL